MRSSLLALLFLSTANAFSVAPGAGSTSTALLGFSAFHYEEPEAIMMEQTGVVPAVKRKPIQTKPSAMSRIRIEKPSDDQHDANYHSIAEPQRNNAVRPNHRALPTLPPSNADQQQPFKTIEAVQRAKARPQAEPYYE